MANREISISRVSADSSHRFMLSDSIYFNVKLRQSNNTTEMATTWTVEEKN